MRQKIIFVLAGLFMLSLLAYGATTVTNRGDVISVQKLSDTSSDNTDLTVYQDFSVYPTKPGQSGKVVRFYDFDKLGGAASTQVKLLPAVALKDNMFIRNGYVYVMDGIDPAGSITNSLDLNAAGDLLAAATNTFHTAGMKAVIPVGTATSGVQLTADRYVSLTVGSVAITNGKFMVVLDCEMAP